MKLHKNGILIRLLIGIISIGMAIPLVANSSLDSIDWPKQLSENCQSIWPTISLKVDSSASPYSLVECGRCALKQEESDLALTYFSIAEKKGYRNKIALSLVRTTAYIQLHQDSTAIQSIKELSSKLNVYRFFSIPEFKTLADRNPEATRIMMASRPSLDAFTFVMSVVCFIGFFVSILFFIKGKNQSHAQWLALFIANFSLIMTSYVLYWTGFNFPYPYLNEWWQSLYLLIGPLFYFYISSLFEKSISKLQRWIHLLPFIIAVLVSLLSGRYSFFQGIPDFNFRISYAVLNFPIKLLSLFYYLYRSYQVSQGDWMVDKLIADWTKYLLYFFGVFIIANIVYYGCTFLNGFNQSWDYGISAVMAVGIIGISSMGFLESKYLSFHSHQPRDIKAKSSKSKTLVEANQKHKKNKLPIQPKPSQRKYQSSTLTTAASQSIKTHLDQLMREQKIFLKEDLRLQTLAELLGVHKNQLSQVINENYGVGFFDWINGYRIHHAVDLLSIPKCPYTISQIGFESGFNNKVTFYKVFRQYFHCTPLEHIAKLEEERARMS